MARNEKTSKRVAAIAGRVLAIKAPADEEVLVFDKIADKIVRLRWRDVRALAASALTQAADKPKKKARR